MKINKTQIALAVSVVIHILGVFGIVPPAVGPRPPLCPLCDVCAPATAE